MSRFSVNKDGINSAREDALQKHFFTTLQMLDVHYGIRRGVYSLLMGTPSCGKSGLAKLIGVQASTTPHTKVLFWLSEESKEKYAVGLDKYCDETGVKIENIMFFEEKTIDKKLVRTHQEFLNYFKEIVCEAEADLVIIDNITSSRFYGPQTSLKDQGVTVEFLKEYSHLLDIGMLAVIHTSSDVSDNMGRLFTTEDNRGLKAIGIEAAYFYALQKFTSNGNIFTFSRNLKHRFHSDASGTFLLQYDPRCSMYIGDRKVQFEEVKKIFQQSDRLK